MKSFSGPLSKFLSVLFALVTWTGISFAETYTIKVNANGVPVSNVNVFGNRGVNDLPGNFTNSLGIWAVDTTNLHSSDFTIGFSHGSRSLIFEPAEISPSLSACPGRICEITAYEGSKAYGIIGWKLTDNSNHGISGIPVSVPGSNVPCAKYTDNDGYVFFSVLRQNSSCNDGDTNLTNNFYKISPLQRAGFNCTFTAMTNAKYNACLNGGDFSGQSLVSCTAAADIAIGSNVSYEISVTLDNGTLIPSTQFFGVTSLHDLATDDYGKFKFTTTQAGLDPASSFSLVPYSAGYLFSPSVLNLSPNSCPGNKCKVTAYKNGVEQSISRWKVADASLNGKQGVDFTIKDPFVCPTQTLKSNAEGFVYFPTRARSSCDMSDKDIFNNFLTVNPFHLGCTFTHNSQTPFQSCPGTGTTSSEISINCSTNSESQYLVTGKIFDQVGLPLSGIKLNNNGLQVATSDSSGSYSIMVDTGSTLKLTIESDGVYIFDPMILGIADIDRDHSDINFYAVIPDTTFTNPPPPSSSCPAKDEYEISGFVTDENGAALSGVTIYDGYEEVAVTDNNGAYSFTSLAGAGLWIRAEFFDNFTPDGAYFDPAAHAIPDNYCDAANVNFRKTMVESHMLYGKVLDLSGEIALAGAEVTLEYSGITRTAVTNSEGEYFHSVPDGEDFRLTAVKEGHNLSPESYEEFAGRSYFNLDFNSDISLLPTPTPTNTPTITFTPSRTSTPTVTRTPTRTYTASATATATKTPTFTNTQTFTATASSTQTPTNTPTATRTLTASITPTSSSTYTASVTPTSSSTYTATMTFTNTNTPTNTETPTITFTPSITPTSTNTHTASNTPTATHTFTASATETATQTPSNTATFTATHTATNTPTATKTETPTKTFTPTKTATPTSTPYYMPKLNSMCSDVATVLRWSTSNVNAYPLDMRWEIYGTNQKASFTLEAYSSFEFQSTKITGTNTARLFVNNVQVDVLNSNLQPCTLPTNTPTNTPTITYTPSATNTPDPGRMVTICHLPPGNPSNYHTLEVSEFAVLAHLGHGDYMGACKDPDPTPAPTYTYTVTSTPNSAQTITPAPTKTSTPIPSKTSTPINTPLNTPPPTITVTPKPSQTPIVNVSINGVLRGKNGRLLSSIEKRRYAAMDIYVVAKQTGAEKRTYKYKLDETFSYSISVPKGEYYISLESDGFLIVASTPKKYRSYVMKDQEILFAVRAKTTSLTAKDK